MNKVYMMCGKVGSGKSTYADRLSAEKQIMVLSSDYLMLHLFDECIGPEKHHKFLTRCKDFLYSQAFGLLGLEQDVILDFGFWKREERDYARELFGCCGVETKLIYMNTNYDIITKNLAKRNNLVLTQNQLDYHIDDEKRTRFDSEFEPPQDDEQHIEIKDFFENYNITEQ